MALTDITNPPPPAWEAHPIYVVLAQGVGSFPVGSVVLAGDLGSAADIQAMEQAGQIAPRHTADAQGTLQQAATDAAAIDVPTQQGVPYVDPSGGDVSTSASRTAKRASSNTDTGSSTTTPAGSSTPTS